VTGLTWQQVDLERKLAWVHPDQAKGRRAIPVPLNEAALRTLEKQIGKHPTIVFTYSGRSIEQVSTAAWYKALKPRGDRGLQVARPSPHLGQLGGCNRGCRCLHCRRWPDGRRRAWRGATLTLLRAISPPTLT
jgi:hypothetical protein